MPIAMAYVDRDTAGPGPGGAGEPGDRVEVAVGSGSVSAQVVELPFYRRG